MLSNFFSQLAPVGQILLAAFLGAVVGLEREHRRKEAGLRTFALVAMWSAFFTVAAMHFSGSSLAQDVQLDPVRVIQAVAIGIGFIGSGLIIQRKAQVEGLTTAAALWATAAIGIGVGLQIYLLSILAALLIMAILGGLSLVEKAIFKKNVKK